MRYPVLRCLANHCNGNFSQMLKIMALLNFTKNDQTGKFKKIYFQLFLGITLFKVDEHRPFLAYFRGLAMIICQKMLVDFIY